MKVKALVLTGYGLNSDKELRQSFLQSGAECDLVHLNDLIESPKRLNDYQILGFPGGFSFGDHIASGKIFANKVKNYLMDDINSFIDNGKLIIGICNGFQILVKLGILPGLAKKQEVSLTFNDSACYEDRWVSLKVNPNSPCVWLNGIENLYVPVRHGEGKFVVTDENVAKELVEKNLIAVQYTTPEGNTDNVPYPYNPNGAWLNTAGICSENGRVFGLMPHPEAHICAEHHPNWRRLGLSGDGEGLKIFKNAVNFVSSNGDF